MLSARPMYIVPFAVVLAIVVTTVGVVTPQAGRSYAPAAQARSGDGYGLLLANSADLGPVAPSQSLSLVLNLNDPSAARQASDLAAIYAAGSPKLNHYLSESTVASRYGPSPSIMQRVFTVLKRLGLKATWQRGNNWAVVTGPSSRIEQAFGVHVHWYRSPEGTRFYASQQHPELPAVLRSLATGAGRISSFFVQPRQAVPAGGVSPTDVLSAYDITPLRNLGIDGTGQTVAFLESDGGWSQADFDTFTQKYGLPPLKPELVSGSSGMPPDPETEMDLEVVHEIAPGARLLVYNFPFSQTVNAAKTESDVLTPWLQLQDRMVTDNQGAVLSMSMGLCDKLWDANLANAYKNVYDHADALGESVFVSTGDSAAYSCIIMAPNRNTAPAPEYLGAEMPSADPGVTAVGGTRLSLSTNHGWYNETVWEYPIETNGTGGGISASFPMPSWQQGPGVSNPQLNPKNMREVPDVSADADVASGTANYIGNSSGGGGSWQQGGGTSQATPIWAGIAALFNQYMQKQGLHNVGFLNPALYKIAVSASPFAAFHDVTEGTNLYYPATPYYDMASGLGTPDAWNLVRDLEAYQKSGGQ